MVKNKTTISVPFFDMFKYAFVGTFGVISAYILVALYSLIFVSIGLYLINKYNKKILKHSNNYNLDNILV